MTQRFTLGNFNVRNLVPKSTAGDYHFFYSARRHNCYWAEGDRNTNRYRQKIDWLACQLDRMSADIVCFQEIFALAPLQEVIDAANHAGKAKLYLAGETSFQTEEYEGRLAKVYRQPLVAMMVASDFKMLQFDAISDFPQHFDFSNTITDEAGRQWKFDLLESNIPLNRFSRPVAKARIRLPTRFGNARTGDGKPAEITLFSAHLKSKRPVRGRTPMTKDLHHGVADYLLEEAIGRTRSLLVRALEAAALRALVLEELKRHPERPVFILGDLNDSPRSQTTEITAGLTQPQIFLEGDRASGLFEQMESIGADMALYSAYHLQTQRTHRDVYYTHIFDGHYDILDHVLVSSHFVPLWARDGKGSTNIGKVGTLRVFNDHLLNAEIDDLHAQKVGKYLHTRSDHGQVTARIDWFEK